MKNVHSEVYKNLKLNICYTRKMQGLSQIQLAEKVGINRAYMSRIEAVNSDTVPSLAVIFDLANALDVSLDKLFDFD